MWHGRKIAGAAQRRTRRGLLIQGSVQPPPIGLNRDNWETAMRETAQTGFSVEWEEMAINSRLRNLVNELRAEKYGQPSYTQKR
jgi:lipoate-protein ligase A